MSDAASYTFSQRDRWLRNHLRTAQPIRREPVRQTRPGQIADVNVRSAGLRPAFLDYSRQIRIEPEVSTATPLTENMASTVHLRPLPTESILRTSRSKVLNRGTVNHESSSRSKPISVKDKLLTIHTLLISLAIGLFIFGSYAGFVGF